MSKKRQTKQSEHQVRMIAVDYKRSEQCGHMRLHGVCENGCIHTQGNAAVAKCEIILRSCLICGIDKGQSPGRCADHGSRER